MLTDASEEEAISIATFLEGHNRQRQATERKILEQAVEQVIEQKLDAERHCAIVLGHEDWHPGVIGIVASRIVEKFHRPAIMVALSNGHGQGSGRSITGFHLARALQDCTALLETHGGHEMAAGLRVKRENFQAFRERFCEVASRLIPPEMLVPELKIDAEATLSQFSASLVNDIHRLGPFGQGNRRPVLTCRNVEIAAPPRRVGKAGDHLQLQVRQGGHQMKCIAFGKGELEPTLRPGALVDLAVEAAINEYNGRVNVELEIKDLQLQPA